MNGPIGSVLIRVPPTHYELDNSTTNRREFAAKRRDGLESHPMTGLPWGWASYDGGLNILAFI